MSTIPCMGELEMLKTTFDERTVMRWQSSHFWPFRRVSLEAIHIDSTRADEPMSRTADKQFQDSVSFRKFRWQLFHTSLTHILSPLKPFMTNPRVTRCGDGYYRRVIYGLGPYIADYPEQVLLGCVVSGWCPKSVRLISHPHKSD